jgi:hypothetical protein
MYTAAFWINLVGVALAGLIGAMFTLMRLDRRYRPQVRYALKTSVARILIVFNSACCVAVAASVWLGGPIRDVSWIHSHMPSLFAVISPFVTGGLLALILVPTNRIPNSNTYLLSLGRWLTRAIQEQIDSGFAQIKAEVVWEIERTGAGADILRSIGEQFLNNYSVGGNGNGRRARLKAFRKFAHEHNVTGMIDYLCQFCTPTWLLQQVKNRILHKSMLGSHRDLP